MLGGDPSGAPPAMRSALRLLAAGLLLLGSAPGTGVSASSSPPPSPSSLVTTTKPVSGAPPSALPTPATSGKPVSSLTGLTMLKSESPLPPSASSSPSPAGPPETPPVGTSPKTVSASAPGSGAAGAPDLPVSVAPVRSTSEGATLAHVASPTSRTSPEGVASKDLTSPGQTSKPSLLPTTPSVPKPGGSTAEKSSGSPPVPVDISARPAVISGSVTPESPTPRKDVTTLRDNAASMSPTLVLGHSKMPDRTAPTVIKPTGPASGTTSPSSVGDISTPPDLKIKPSLVSLTTTSPQERHSLPPAGGTNHTSLQARSKIVCEKTVAVDNRMILLTLNESKPCNSLEGSALKETLLETLCKAVKPNLNKDRDECTVRLASDREDPARLAVVGVSVQTNSVEDELSEALAAKKAQLEKLGVHNITHGGRPLDTEPRDHLSLPLIITIICMAASLLLVAAIYGCCHQRISHRKDQRLTEELHTIENGYHDNPTLEVTEISSEMQEKKINLNGELGDSWIVPMDSLVKDDLDEEEDTHL